MTETVAEAAAAKAEAGERLEAAIVRAHQQGHPISRIAGMAAMSRQAIYDLLARRGVR